MNKIFTILAILILSCVCAYSQTPVKKTILQAFWWDYENNNYPAGWANYLADLAPRLRSIGVDAVWIPPSTKGGNGTADVGYGIFDHYDLGDKFQKNTTKTRLGTKDELLRMIAIMHANGIEVIQDVVPNHTYGAGSYNGSGGQDPTAWGGDLWKNFRYAAFETPVTDESATDYLARKGRFYKNWQNFHPNPGDNCSSGDICSAFFGPDNCYNSGASGISSNATYNPTQTSTYMRDSYRNWLIWYKKQTGFDGVRLDAVKHFEYDASEDFLYNMQFTASWASGGNAMPAVGEFVGSTGQLDGWCNSVMNRAGTFDFNLRAFGGSGGLYSMIYGNGGYDMGSLPAEQQSNRYVDISGQRIHRTVPFINNHDTYRPQLSGGNISGWNSGSELSPHVDIREPRLAAAYAVMVAMDGNPQIFFEDVFNIANTSKRLTHLPNNTTDLPENSDIANIIRAHGAFNFKAGDYFVRSAESRFWNSITSDRSDDDYIVIERGGKAIIGATDQWNIDQDAWIDTDFALGTVLRDYSGGITTTTTVLGPESGGTGKNRVNIKTKAVGYPSYTYSTSYTDHGVQYHGFSIWAPDGMSINYTPSRAVSTTQEWELDNDLGDSHCSSLRQGGRTPDNKCYWRVAGRVFAAAGTSINVQGTLGGSTSLTVGVFNNNGLLVSSNAGTSSPISVNYAVPSTGWYSIKVRNTSCTTGQKSFVKVTYQAPANVSTSSYPAQYPANVYVWNGNANTTDWSDCNNWEDGRIPPTSGCAYTVVVPNCTCNAMLPTLPADCMPTVINELGATVSLDASLISFAATVKNKNAHLTWKVTSEEDVKEYEVEKSLDASQFDAIATVPARQNSQTINTYEYTDEQFKQDAYYRLKILSYNGEIQYSNTLFLPYKESRIFNVVPNPATADVTLVASQNFDNTQLVRVQLIGINGQTLLSQTGTISTLNISLNEILRNNPKGLYIVNVFDNNKLESIKLLKH
ncbi:MAG: T9SS type A sorting domain-containing protein [Saprospiraceae bacterium]|nr:T9SS type A sorting domain-containing protein [Saprospiraceae bacterium]MBP7679749.1 T9SS type A sorting domain-containing protein [Saprospiraceae bacterium]